MEHECFICSSAPAGGIIETTRVRPYNIRTFEKDDMSLNSNFIQKSDEIRFFRVLRIQVLT